MTGDLIFYKYNGNGYYDQTNYTAIDGDTIGVHIGKDLVGALFAPVPMKGNLTNTIRNEHGTRFKEINYLAERSVTLNLVITGATRTAHNTNLESLLQILYNGHFGIKTVRSDNVYFLCYENCNSYNLTRRGCSSQLAVKCVEYNPTQRAWTNTTEEETGGNETGGGNSGGSESGANNGSSEIDPSSIGDPIDRP